MKKGSILLLCLFLMFCAVLAVGCREEKVPASISISSENNATEIKMGETLQLTATVNPDGVSQEVLWTSSNESVATVSAEGLVTAVAEGNVVITATSSENSSVSKNFALVVTYQSVVNPEDKVPTEIRLSTNGNATEVVVGKMLLVAADVRPLGVSQEVVWTSSNNDIATVSENGYVTGVSEGTVIITATCKDVETVSGSITIEVKAASQGSENAEYCTHEEYMSAENDTQLKVKGVVTYILPENDGTVCYYLQDGVDGYYIYQQDVVNYPVQLGVAYAVGGYKYYKNGVNELKNVDFCQQLDEEITVTTVELNDKDVSSLSDMSVYHGAKISATATITSLPTIGTNAYSVYISIEGKELAIYVNPSNMSAGDFAAISDKFSNAAAGCQLEVVGIMSAYGYGTPKTQILVFNADDISIVEAGAQQKVDVVIDNIAISTYVNASTNNISLPTSSETFEDVTISWQSDTDNVITNQGVVVHPEKDTVVTLTATASHNTSEAQATISFKVYVEGTSFTGTATVSLTFEETEVTDAGEGQYGLANIKSSYLTKDANGEATVQSNTVSIGGHNWLLWNVLVAKAGSDHVSDSYGARTQANAKEETTGRIELLEEGNFDYIQFDSAVYGSNSLGICLRIEYKLANTDEWVVAYVVSIDSYEISTLRFILPEGEKSVAISVVPNSGTRVNVDNIILGELGE